MPYIRWDISLIFSLLVFPLTEIYMDHHCNAPSDGTEDGLLLPAARKSCDS